jgi:hypothetical protein
VDVEFTDLARQALVNLCKDDTERWRQAIRFKLLNDSILDQSRRLPRPDGKAVYIFMLWDLQITFEATKECRTVWGVTRTAATAS